MELSFDVVPTLTAPLKISRVPDSKRSIPSDPVTCIVPPLADNLAVAGIVKSQPLAMVTVCALDNLNVPLLIISGDEPPDSVKADVLIVKIFDCDVPLETVNTLKS